MKNITINNHRMVKRMARLFSFLAMALFLSACVTTSKLVKPSDTNSVVEFTEKLQSSTSAGLDAAITWAAREQKNYRGFVKLDTYWCPRHKEVYGTQAVIREYEKFCAAKGGNYSRSFCVSNADQDTVLFYAKITNPRNKCEHYETAQVTVLEPTGDKTNNYYMRALRQHGFKTTADIENAKKYIKEQARQNALQLERDMPMMKKIGTKICKDERRYTHVGYVERVAEEKIQIRVANIHMKGRPNLQPGGFTPSIIWDYPQNWHVCE